MESSIAPPQTSILGLVRRLTEDSKTLIRQELDLAKAEVSEKVSYFARNAATLVVGGFVAYAGLIVLLISLGWLGAWGLEQAGLHPVLAEFIGMAGVGILVVVTGVLVLLQGIKALSKESLAPQKTIHAIKRLKPTETPPKAQTKAQVHKHSSSEMQAQVAATENRMTETVEELGLRLSPSHINAQIKNRIREKPYRSGAVAMVTGVISGLVLRKVGRRSQSGVSRS